MDASTSGKFFKPTGDRPMRRPVYDLANITTGSSVLGIRYNCGVMIAADTCVTYGTQTLFQHRQRVYKMNDHILLGASGDIPDFDALKHRIEAKIIQDEAFYQYHQMKPRMLAHWMANEVYDRRTLADPLHVDAVVGGIENDGSPYLTSVDRYGGVVEEFAVATGAALRLGMPLVRGAKPSDRDFTAEEAFELIQQCMKVLYLRYNFGINQYLVGVCSPSKCSVEGPFGVQESWGFARDIIGYG